LITLIIKHLLSFFFLTLTHREPFEWQISRVIEVVLIRSLKIFTVGKEKKISKDGEEKYPSGLEECVCGSRVESESFNINQCHLLLKTYTAYLGFASFAVKRNIDFF
jgi:hypothetical protein